jgi:predicted RND superfamily exporter protein
MENSNQKSSVNKILIALLLLLAIGFGYYYFSTSNKMQEQEQAFVDQKLELQQSLDEMEAQYNVALQDNTSMQGELESAKEAIIAIKKELKKTKANDYSAIKKYKRQIAVLQKQNQRLFFLNDSLNQANTGLNIALDSTQANLQKEIYLKDSLATENTSLSDKLKMGSKLNISTIKVASLKERNSGKFKATDKAKRTDLLKVEYTIMANPIANQGEKNAYVQVLDPTGKVVSAKGDITLENEETVKYSAVNTFDYVNVNRNLLAIIKVDKATMKAGKYLVKTYVEGKLAGTTSFNLK